MNIHPSKLLPETLPLALELELILPLILPLILNLTLILLPLLSHHAAAAGVPQSELSVKLSPVALNLKEPVYVTHAGDGTRRLFIVEKRGRILARDTAGAVTEFLNISNLVSTGEEQGLLSVAFHPRFSENGLFYVNYTDEKGDTVVAEYHATAAGSGPQTGDPRSARPVLKIGQPYENHNGGQLQFGPDGYLYIGMGDGGAANDPHGHGQNMRELLGKMLRIDVNTKSGYRIPPDNPFAQSRTARHEIWAAGMRNPWRFSFDRGDARLFAADVGQGALEEIDIIERGKNYGWNRFEGTNCFRGACDREGMAMPVVEYDHTEGISVTGGYVYRGKSLPALQGKYVFGDFGTMRVWTIEQRGRGWERKKLLQTEHLISSFGEDEDGELYLVDFKGAVYRFGPPGA